MKSIFKGRIVKKVYEFYSYNDEISNSDKTEGYKTFCEIELEVPPLNAGDDFYITKIDEAVHINKTMRGVEEDNLEIMVYFTNKIVDRLKDDTESLQRAKDAQHYHLERKEKERDEYNKKNKKWYHFWK